MHSTTVASGLRLEITPQSAGWEHIWFQSRALRAGESWEFASGENELALVVLTGALSVESNRGAWANIGRRRSVFEGGPSALYLPRRTSFIVRADSDVEFVATWVATDRDYAPCLVRPEDSPLEIRGGDNATRQINGILPPGFLCHRLVIVEVLTPSGSWSSYPPHKHDVHKVDATGNVLEVDLEEVYYYRIDKPAGFALQRVYTDPESPLHRAGAPIDAVMVARDGDAVLVPEGYHPVTSAPGYTAYYLNVLAGSAQSLANSDDPVHTWVKHSYRGQDPRVPLYKMNERS
ncbi:MAG: 5-deoxy-glucuronate isomerase [Chloroflexi bacterium]|nr:5-deoxy-glucuronate isomerase [Chloroflexota bacterium]